MNASPQTAVTILLKNAGGGIVLVQRKKDLGGPDCGRWQLPSGGRKRCDKTVAETALRELSEELGIVSNPSSAANEEIRKLVLFRQGPEGFGIVQGAFLDTGMNKIILGMRAQLQKPALFSLDTQEIIGIRAFSPDPKSPLYWDAHSSKLSPRAKMRLRLLLSRTPGPWLQHISGKERKAQPLQRLTHELLTSFGLDSQQLETSTAPLI